jgi:hypothetical protein
VPRMMEQVVLWVERAYKVSFTPKACCAGRYRYICRREAYD